MFSFLRRLFQRKSLEFEVYVYGQYLLKPITSRALSVVLNIPQPELESKILNRALLVFLNDDLIDMTNLHARLESGYYEIKIPKKKTIYKFHIL